MSWGGSTPVPGAKIPLGHGGRPKGREELGIQWVRLGPGREMGKMEGARCRGAEGTRHRDSGASWIDGSEGARTVPRDLAQSTGWDGGVSPGLVEDAELSWDVVVGGLGQRLGEVAPLVRRCRMEAPDQQARSGGRRSGSLHGNPRGHSHRDRDLQSLWNQGKSFHKAMVCYAMAFWLSPDLLSDSERSLC